MESVFYQRGQFFKREFTFSVNHDEIEDRAFDTDAQDCFTSIELRNVKAPFDKSLPKNAITIANRILQHCLIYFIAKDCPHVELIDGQERTDLNQLCREKIFTDSNIKQLRSKEANLNSYTLRRRRLALAGTNYSSARMTVWLKHAI